MISRVFEKNVRKPAWRQALFEPTREPPKKGFEAGKWRENGEKKAAGEKKERKSERRIERNS